MSEEKQAASERFDLVQDYVQGFLDVLVHSDALEHVPVVKTLTAAVKAIGSVRDAILVKKMARFLEALSDVSPEERAEMVHRLEADPSYNRKVGLHLIELLDRVDSHRKPAMLGFCFLAFVQRRIDAVQLQRLVSAVERLPTLEIDFPRVFVNAHGNLAEKSSLHQESIQALANAGLAHPSNAQGGVSYVHGVTYVETPTCGLFVALNLDVRSAKIT